MFVLKSYILSPDADLLRVFSLKNGCYFCALRHVEFFIRGADFCYPEASKLNYCSISDHVHHHPCLLLCYINIIMQIIYIKGRT